MTQPSSSPGSNNPQPRKTNQPPAGIVNDLPNLPPSPSPAPGGNKTIGNQSMIINDLLPPGGAPPAGQMIINDLPSPADQQRVQRMLVEEPKYPVNASASQQMIVNDMAYVDVAKKMQELQQMAGEQRTPRVSLSPQPMVINAPQPESKPRQEEPVRTPRTLPQKPELSPGPVIKRESPANPAGIINDKSQSSKAENPGQILTREARRPAPPPQSISDVPAPQQPQSRPKTQTQTVPPASPTQVQENSSPKEQKKGKKPVDPNSLEAGYSGRTMTPSLIGCVILTALVVWAGMKYLSQVLSQDLLLMTLGGVVGCIWAMQLIRWGYRVLCFKYRLTQEQLTVRRGLLYGKPVQVPRTEILKVTISANLLEKMLGVGKVVVERNDPKSPKIELEGVRRPKEFVDRLQQAK